MMLRGKCRPFPTTADECVSVMKELSRLGTPGRRRPRTALRLACSVLEERRLLELNTVRMISGSTALDGSRGKGKGKGGRPSGVEQKQRRSGGGERGAKGGGVSRVTKGGASGLWMKRHLKDPYVSAAIEAGAPSRAAFKLVEINDKHGVLSAGDRVVDLGAAPGGWSMVAARIVHARGPRNGGTQQRGSRGAGGRGGAPPRLPPPLPEARVEAAARRGRRGAAVVAVDLLDLETDLPGVETIRGDFRDEDVESKIFASLAARERPPETKHGQPSQNQNQNKQQQQQQGSAPPPHVSATKSGERVGLNDEQAESPRDCTTSDGNTHGEAFLLRGTSASRALLPRPEQPPTDDMEELFLSAARTARPPATTTTAENAPKQPLPSPNSRGRDGGLPEENDRKFPTRAPSASPPRPPALHRRRASVVLSDMAPSFSGDRDMDQGRVAALVLDALAACLGDENARRREAAAGGAAGVADGSTSGGAARGDGGGHGRKGNAVSGFGDAATTCDSAGSRGRPQAGAGSEVAPEISRISSSSSDRGSGVSSDNTPSGPGAEELLGTGSGLLARGGTFLGKFFAGRDEREVKQEAERLFETVKVVKPPASRSGSGEMYLLAKGFLQGGPKK